MTTNDRGLIPVEERCKGTGRQSGKAREEDAECAARVVAYFRADFRRFYGRLGSTGTPEWLSKNVFSIVARTEGLTVGDGWRGKERILRLSQEPTLHTDGKYEDEEL